MTQELKEKLEQKKISSCVIDEILKECKRLGYLDDKREIKLFIERAKREGVWAFYDRK